MKPNPEVLSRLTSKLTESEAKLEILTQEIAGIGQPAGHDLLRRLGALNIEERALKRNTAELLAGENPDSTRLAKIEALLEHIESEEVSMLQEADFLHQGSPSSVELIARAGARLLGLCKQTAHRLLGGRQLLGSSVFVNHTNADLVAFHGLEAEKRIHRPTQ